MPIYVFDPLRGGRGVHPRIEKNLGQATQITSPKPMLRTSRTIKLDPLCGVS